MLGGANECFERTMKYLKEREQFGVKIGSFQALKHRAAKIFVDLELARSAVLDALSAIDENRADLAQIASLAKTLLNDTYYLVTNEAVQMHGGIGVTDELDIGLFLKRSRVAIQLLGDSGFHKDRYASLSGY
jgi:alkylation response protein AidB-like acyl-CoA dehydrogenase